jgi:hypothetical protein
MGKIRFEGLAGWSRLGGLRCGLSCDFRFTASVQAGVVRWLSKFLY